MKIGPKQRLGLAGLVVLGGLLGGIQLIRQGFLGPLSDLSTVMCGDACTHEKPVHVPPTQGQWLNAEIPVERLLGNQVDRSKTSVLIEKSQHRLTLYYAGKPVKSYPVVFGGKPKGDKLREGDRKTPEGILRIRDLYPHSTWSKFLWLDYPNPKSWQKHYRAKSKGIINPMAAIGGEVGIHGVPAGSEQWIDDRKNWTLGCPSLKNQDVDELYGLVQVGTIVEILP